MSIASSLSQDINGATVKFEVGAKVSSVKLSSDYSTIQILGLSPGARQGFVARMLAGLGYQVPESSVVVKSLGEVGSVAEVKIEDPKFAKEVARKFDSQQTTDTKSKISMKPLFRNAAGTLVNRLQLSTVNCTWYKPSRPAWLEFECEEDAEAAEDILEDCQIRQRTPTCTIRASGRDSELLTLQLGNFDICTKKKEICTALGGCETPKDIKLGNPTHRHSDSNAANIIEGLLRSKGVLESFQWKSLPGNMKLKATATFSDRDDAAEAVRSLNTTSVSELGKSKIFLDYIVSVKYNVLSSIILAVQNDIDKLRKEIWQDGYVHLKTYAQTEQAKSSAAVRIFGENLKHVAKAKEKIEKLLSGTVVLDGDVALWDPYFLNVTSLAYLNEISKSHKVYIHRDTRKSHLLLYGGSESSRSEVVRTLQAKLAALRHLTHTIILTPELLVKAMQGRVRRLKARFRSEVMLNVLVNPKTVSITGSIADLEEARVLLSNATDCHSALDHKNDTKDCVVCWSEATAPLTTNCGHTYCKDCFANQASSGDLPVRCYGAEGTCLQVFPLNELSTMLSRQAFQELLESSLDTYIRQHPKKFQHCPTPDCPQVYRSTYTKETLLCSTCLSSICTRCNVIAHEGLTCEDYQDLNSGGTKAFEKWKKEKDARDCPDCGAVIEKSEGCNHMECKQCSTHICWFCMETFGSAPDCYGHMQKKHGNFYGY